MRSFAMRAHSETIIPLVWSGQPLKPIRYSKQVRFLNIDFYRVFFNYSIYAEFQTLVFHFKLALQYLQMHFVYV